MVRRVGKEFMQIIEPLPLVEEKIQQMEKRSFKKYLVILLVLVLSIGFSAYLVNSWFQTHYLVFRSPIELHSPISVKERSKLRIEDYTALQKQLENAKQEIERLK